MVCGFCSVSNVLLERILYIALGIFVLQKKARCNESPCADQIQKCGLLVEQFERHIKAAKILAFRNCFAKSPCFKERIVFDECFAKSLNAIRSPLKNGEFNNPSADEAQFVEPANFYRKNLIQCFENSPNDAISFDSSLRVDVNAIYVRAIYLPEFTDRLWGLGEYGIKSPYIDLPSVCFIGDTTSRVFGGGIRRLPNFLNDFKHGNTSACTLSSKDLLCYRQTLDTDFRFQQLIRNRDNALRSCIQRVRSQNKCGLSVTETRQLMRLRACICNSRLILEKQMESSILKCMKNPSVETVFATKFFEFKDEKNYDEFPRPSRSDFRFKQALLPDSSTSSYQTSEDTFSSMTITPGVTLNGQCLCTCAQQLTQKEKSLTPYAASVDSFVPSNEPIKPTVPNGISNYVGIVSESQQSLPVTPSTVDRQVWYYYPQQQKNRLRRPIYRQLDTEDGIINGFERFFSGLPPN